MGIMDYSLYLVVEHAIDANKDINTRNREVSIDGSEVYHFGIIDYL